MKRRVGACFLGALGSISITAIVGALAISKSLEDCVGMATFGEPFDTMDLVSLGELEFFGFDIRQEKLRTAADALAQQQCGLTPKTLSLLEPELREIEPNIYPGFVMNCGEAISQLCSLPEENDLSLRQITEQIQGQINSFKQTRRLDDVVVVNLASTEPPLNAQKCHTDAYFLEKAIDENVVNAFRASSLYAYAAIKSNCPYINFTPSNGALFPAMVQLAQANRVPVMGDDGKTGETLVKSVLAPMFKARNLEVMSWEGFNILGNMDGRVLEHIDNRQSKIKTKDTILPKILGYAPHSSVHINYVPSLADQKTAWDFIHFRGFLGSRMSMQFIWQGFDSMLAAPLVLDLVRLAEFAHRAGEAGLMPHLASYFKAPLGVDQHAFSDQTDLLRDYALSSANKKKSHR